MREKEGYFRCKIKNKKLFTQMKTIFSRFKKKKAVKQCLHLWCTQKNEGLNTSVAKYAPKGKTYCSSVSLSNRISIVIGVQNSGYNRFWNRMFEVLSLSTGSDFTKYLEKKDHRKKRKREYEGEIEQKRKRAKTRHDKMREQFKKQIKDAARGATYGSGVALLGDTPMDIHPEILRIEETRKKLKSQMCTLPGCYEKGHKTNSSKKCKYYQYKEDDELIAAVNAYLAEEYPHYSGERTMYSLFCTRFCFCFFVFL